MNHSTPGPSVHHNSWSLPKLMSVESVMPSNHLILCRPPLLLPLIYPSIRVFSNESALRIRWPKYWSFSFSISPSNEPRTNFLWEGLVGSPWSPRDSQESSPTPQFKSINSLALSFLYSPTLTSIHDYWKTKALTRWTFVSKVMSLLSDLLSDFLFCGIYISFCLSLYLSGALLFLTKSMPNRYRPRWILGRTVTWRNTIPNWMYADSQSFSNLKGHRNHLASLLGVRFQGHSEIPMQEPQGGQGTPALEPQRRAPPIPTKKKTCLSAAEYSQLKTSRSWHLQDPPSFLSHNQCSLVGV